MGCKLTHYGDELTFRAVLNSFEFRIWYLPGAIGSKYDYMYVGESVEKLVKSGRALEFRAALKSIMAGLAALNNLKTDYAGMGPQEFFNRLTGAQVPHV